MKPTLLLFCLFVTTAASAHGGGGEGPGVTTLVNFDPLSESAQNLAFTDDGDYVYVSLLTSHKIARFDEDLNRRDYELPAELFLTAGLVYNNDNNRLYIAAVSPVPGFTGVWELNPRNGNVRQYATMPSSVPALTLLNGMTADEDGNLYVADCLHGFVWLVPPGGGEAELWLDLEAPGPEFPSPTNPPSANGIKFAPNGDLYVGIPVQARIVRIHMRHNGQPGHVSTFVQGPDITPDDFSFDEEGNLYLATEPSHSVMKISPCGDREVIADASDGLRNTTATQFSTRRGEAKVLYITNGAFPGPDNKPSLMRMKVRERGVPVVVGW